MAGGHHDSTATLVRVGVGTGAITLVAIAILLAAAIFAEQSIGKGEAVSLAGELRGHLYRLAVQIADERDEGSSRQQLITQEIAAVDARLAQPQLSAVVQAADAPVRDAYRAVGESWRRLRPLARAAIEERAARAQFLRSVHGFGGEIDNVVGALEEELQHQIIRLHWVLALTAVAIVVLATVGLLLLRAAVLQPLAELIQMTRAARRGSANSALSAPERASAPGEDFREMVDEVARLYGSLEEQIAVKTADLEQNNRSLALLYETTHALSANTVDRAVLQRVLERVRRVLAAERAELTAPPGVDDGGRLIAAAEVSVADRSTGTGAHRAAQGFANNGANSASNVTAAGARRTVVTVVVRDGERDHGALHLTLPPARSLTPEQMELAQTVARHIGAALTAAEAREEHRRLALLEERSAIARELHDSLAQSLSYTKIQLARLSALIAGPAASAEAHAVVDDLRIGVASAYRELRELLTTFRLSLSGKGVKIALAEVVSDFGARSGVQAELNDELNDVQLSANEQIHVLQIVREALTNIEHHAQARHAQIRLSCGTDPLRTIEVNVTDDGVGIAVTDAVPRHHFGLAIMRDRAALLGGSVAATRQAQGGTRVVLRFVAAAAAAQALRDAPLPSGEVQIDSGAASDVHVRFFSG